MDCLIDIRGLCNLLDYLLSGTENVVKKSVEDVMPIATGHEREELEAELQVSYL